MGKPDEDIGMKMQEDISGKSEFRLTCLYGTAGQTKGRQ